MITEKVEKENKRKERWDKSQPNSKISIHPTKLIITHKWIMYKLL